jgi:hypothetical protein
MFRRLSISAMVPVLALITGSPLPVEADEPSLSETLGWMDSTYNHRGHRLGTENGRRSLLTARCIAYFSVELLISLIMDAV